LPVAVQGIKAVNINNEIFTVGGRRLFILYASYFVLKYDVSSQSWLNVANMSSYYLYPGLSVINTKDVAPYCLEDSGN